MTEQELRDQVWGPYRFSSDAAGVDDHGREVAQLPLVLGHGRVLSMSRTPLPHWTSGPDVWFNEHEGKPVRLMLLCERAGYRTWRIVWEGLADRPEDHGHVEHTA
ncbi:hypothetical protein [Catellatospora sichuanensis]|uniref:hypothetical protein n=1 Tax=Catellatospora sichuanensis TaxID=1969805 RepID=UPI001181D1D2|nr:hypothetical protein [Catellatospora sichuanensis]